MAGAGRRVFTPGEVLTASNVMSYLQDQAVMVFDDAAARGSAIGTAVVSEGMTTYLKDTDELAYYDGSTWQNVFGGTAVLPVANGGTGGTSVATAQDNLGVGLVNVVPTSATVSTGSATINTVTGLITLSSANTLRLYNVFNSDITHYVVAYYIDHTSPGTSSYFRLHNNGTDLGAAGSYNSGSYRVRSDNGSWSYIANNSSVVIMGGSSNALNMAGEMKITNPGKSLKTYFSGQHVLRETDSITYLNIDGSQTIGTAAYNGLTFITDSANMTGNIQIFAMKAT